MAGINLNHTEEESQQTGVMDEQMRLRAEIEQQLEAERQMAHRSETQKTMRATAAMAMWEREEARQRKTTSRPLKHRSYTTDALLLCAVTLGLGSWLGPTLFPPAPQYQQIARPMPPLSGAMPSFISAPWTFENAIDAGGNNWNGSAMNITEQIQTPTGYDLSGSFDWYVDGKFAGTEQFAGEYDAASRSFHVVGGEITPAATGNPVHLVPGDYSATVASDGHTLINGYMQGAPGVSAFPGPFGAQQ